MINPWDNVRKIKCIVLCAGRGMRMSPQTEDIPKVFSKIKGKPVIDFVIDYWKKFTSEFIFIVGYKKEMVIEHVSNLPIQSAFIEQKERKGIAHAILHAENEIEDKFIVVLGDCVCKGKFAFPSDMNQGVGVWKTNNEQDIRLSYSVEIEDNLIKKVVEKPKVIMNDLCGMGFYFFSKILFKYIRETPPSTLRNEVEITDVIQKMIESKEPVSPVWLEGDYINITFPSDLERAVKIINSNKLVM